MHHLLAFEIDNHQFGLHVPLVQRVVHACEITPIPDSPPAVLGVINVHGVVTLVLNTRRKLGLPERGVAVSDYFVIASSGTYNMALHVDAIKGLVEYSEDQLVSMDDVVSQKSATSVVRVVDGLILVYDPNKSLNETEQRQLAVALDRMRKANEQGT